MLVNYLKIAFRNLFRHKAFSFINILGLAIGMACSIFILLWVRNELSYDALIRTLILFTGYTASAGDFKAAVTPAAVARGIKRVRCRSLNMLSA